MFTCYNNFNMLFTTDYKLLIQQVFLIKKYINILVCWLGLTCNSREQVIDYVTV